MSEPVTPLQQLALDIQDLENQRDGLYQTFQDINAALLEKKKCLDAFTLVLASPSLQKGLVIEMQNNKFI
jgi:hypothetical protein